MITSKLGRYAAIAIVSAVVLFGGVSASSAGGSPSIPDGSIWQSDMAKPVNDLYLRTQPGSVGKAQLKPEVTNELAYGKGSVVEVVAPRTIKNIGGKFAERATFLGLFQLHHGTWLITTNAVFNRTVAAPAGATKTRPQLALRVGSERTNAGTIMGVDISPAMGRELMGATVQTVTVSGINTVVVVYGFGYNDDGSDFASGQITVSGQITATRIG